MTTLAKVLIQTPPRETAGARSSNRFGFQHSWALCKILELQAGCGDYVVIAEFHDDVIVLDSATTPKTVEFYQVKTKKGAATWTRKSLLSRRKTRDGHKPSILGRLFDNHTKFKPHVRRLAVVSNIPYNLKLTNGESCRTRHCICLDELDSSETKEIETKLCNELGSPPPLTGTNIAHLDVTTLSLDEHEQHALGKLADFFSSHAPEKPVLLKALFQSLAAEVRRRSRNESTPSTFSELVQQRGISRSSLNKMLSDATAASADSKIRERAEQRLNVEGAPVQTVARMSSATDRFLVNRMNPEHKILGKAVDEARALIAANKRATLHETMNLALDPSGDALTEVISIWGKDAAKAAMVIATYEQ